MADAGDNIFVYFGGEQEVPADVTHVRIDRSVKIIPDHAFLNRQLLVSVETHDGIEIVEEVAFCGCWSLRGIKLPGVKEVGNYAFLGCESLTDVEFGDKLETIGAAAFRGCHSLRNIKMPSVRYILHEAFRDCVQLEDLEFGDKLERVIEPFTGCTNLQRIAIPLKDDMFHLVLRLPYVPDRQGRDTVFDDCGNLTKIDLVGMGGIHNTIASLLLKSWRDEIYQQIGFINQFLPNIPANQKAAAIQTWIRCVLLTIEHYKAKHHELLKEHMTQLELALWKINLDEKEDDSLEGRPNYLGGQLLNLVFDVFRRLFVQPPCQSPCQRNERRITSGASIVIKNVLPFLQLE